MNFEHFLKFKRPPNTCIRIFSAKIKKKIKWDLPWPANRFYTRLDAMCINFHDVQLSVKSLRAIEKPANKKFYECRNTAESYKKKICYNRGTKLVTINWFPSDNFPHFLSIQMANGKQLSQAFFIVNRLIKKREFFYWKILDELKLNFFERH